MRLKDRFAQIPWMVIGTPLGVLGTQIDAPWSFACYVASAICTIAYGIFHVRERQIKPDCDGNNAVVKESLTPRKRKPNK